MAKQEKTLQEKFFHAAYNGPKDMSRLFIRETLKTNPEAAEWLDDGYGRTGLILAAWNGRLEIVQEFLDAGVNPNQRGEDSMTALMLACARGHLDVVKALKKGGADINLEYEDGLNCAEFAKHASKNRKDLKAFLAEWQNEQPQPINTTPEPQ